MRTAKVRVPATSANLGPGFDCLGLALALYNRVSLRPLDSAGVEVVVSGEGKDAIPTDQSNLALRAAGLVFDRLGRRPAGLRLELHNEIPVGSGLGSSAAAIVGGLLAANALVEGELDQATLLQMAAALEGHPDNVAPALYGGLTLAVQAGEELVVERLPVGHMKVVIVLPAANLPTASARAALPATVPLADAVFNLGRLGLLLPALAAGDFESLDVATADRLHQPYRLPLIPGMTAAFAAARAAGAAAVMLSGAGPSLMALSGSGHEGIAAACIGAFAAAGLASRWWVLDVDREGSRLA